jgi:transcriptional regulator with XRE-family HTH domain
MLSCMDLGEVFATNLRRIRNAKGLSQDDLAYDAGISRSYLSQLEKGVFYASLKIIEKLAAGRGASRVFEATEARWKDSLAFGCLRLLLACICVSMWQIE